MTAPVEPVRFSAIRRGASDDVCVSGERHHCQFLFSPAPGKTGEVQLSEIGDDDEIVMDLDVALDLTQSQRQKGGCRLEVFLRLAANTNIGELRHLLLHSAAPSLGLALEAKANQRKNRPPFGFP